MGLIETIKLTVKGLRDVTPSLFSLTNQSENKATKLVFEFENENLKGLYKYIVFTHSNAKDRCVIFPLINDEFIVRNDISSFDGRWYIQLIMRDLEIDLNQDSIKLETLDNDEMTIITNPIVAIVKKNTFDAEVLENMPLDENLQIVYDDLLRLKTELEEIIGNGGSSGGGTVVSGITDVKINDTSVVSGGVANIPVASVQNKHGLIQVKNAHGMMVTQEGYIYPMIACDTEIDNRTNYRWITSKNVDYAVKTALTDGKGAEWTQEEKANARERMGVDVLETNINMLNKALDTKLTQPYINIEDKTTLTDSDFGLIKDLEIKGKTTQIQYTGKNLLDVPQKISYDKSIIFDIDIPPGVFTLSCGNVSGGGSQTIRLFHSDGNQYTWQSITTNKTLAIDTTSINKPLTKLYLYANGFSDSASEGYSGTVENLQIEKGETATAYEQYVGGKAIPNAENPQEIQSTNKLDIKLCGKNLCKPFVYDYALTLQKGEEQASTTNKTTDFINYDISQSYYLTIGNNANIMLFGYDENKEFVSRTGPIGKQVLTSAYFSVSQQAGKTNEDIKYIRAVIPLVDGVYDEKIQLEVGTKATAYEPYKEQVVSYELPINLQSGQTGASYDYIDLEKGKLIQTIKTIRLTSNMQYNTGNNMHNPEWKFFYTKPSDMDQRQYLDDTFYCNVAVNGRAYEVKELNDVCGLVLGQIRIMLKDYQTVESFKDYIDTHECLVTYPLAQPIEHDLPQELLYDLKALYSHYGTTNIVSTLPIKFNYKLSMPSWYNAVSGKVAETREILYNLETETLINSINNEYYTMLLDEGVF